MQDRIVGLMEGWKGEDGTLRWARGGFAEEGKRVDRIARWFVGKVALSSLVAIGKRSRRNLTTTATTRFPSQVEAEEKEAQSFAHHQQKLIYRRLIFGVAKGYTLEPTPVTVASTESTPARIHES